jgi:AmiR/NasT family two-component response regulator
VTGSKDIRALSEDEAFQWLQEHNMVGQAQKHFADRIEPA